MVGLPCLYKIWFTWLPVAIKFLHHRRTTGLSENLHSGLSASHYQQRIYLIQGNYASGILTTSLSSNNLSYDIALTNPLRNARNTTLQNAFEFRNLNAPPTTSGKAILPPHDRHLARIMERASRNRRCRFGVRRETVEYAVRGEPVAG